MSKRFLTGASFAGDITLDDDLNFSTNGFADISNTGTGAMRFKPSGQTLALTLTGANATFAGNVNTTSGNLSINGTGFFASTLTVSTSNSNILTLNRTTSAGGYMRFQNNGTDKFYIGSRGTVSGSGGTGYDIYAVGGNDIRFFPGTLLALTLDTSANATFAGNVTVGANTVQNGTNPGLKIQSTNTSQTVLGLHNTTTRNWEVACGGSANSIGAGSFYIYDNTAADARLEINTSGNTTFAGSVTAPTFLGDLNGTINTATTATTKGNATNDTTVATTAFVQNVIGTIPAGLVFQGTWNASTNTPTLSSGSGTTGHFYIVSVAGSTNLDGITDWEVGDWAVFIEQGASDQWEKIDNSSVLSGSGTGGSFAGWSGSGTSVTLGNAPVTFSGNNSTFAGNIDVNGTASDIAFVGGSMNFKDSNNYIRITKNSASAQLGLFRGSNNVGGMYIGGSDTGFRIYTEGFAQKFLLSQTGDGTFAGTVETTTLRTDVVNNKANSANIIYRSGTSTLVGGGSTANKLYVLDSGSIGIGTTSPNAKTNIENGHLLVSQSANTTQENILLQGAGYHIGSTLYGNVSIRSNYNNSTNSGTLNFYTAASGANTTERMRIDSSGNIGIGTTSPSEKLVVQDGKVLAGHTNTRGYGFHDLSNYTYTANTGRLSLVSNGTEAVSIDSSGNVKVGRPAGYGSSKVQSFIACTANFATSNFLAADSTNMAAGVGGEITFVGKYATGVDDYAFYGGIKGFKENATSGNTACALGFYTRPTGTLPSEKLRITSGGNVGIGTTSPSTLISNSSVRNAAASGLSTSLKGLNIEVPAGGNSQGYVASFANTQTASNNYNAGVLIEVGSTDTTTRLLSVESGGTNRFEIRGDGNVGIGTTSPIQKLDTPNIVIGGSTIAGTYRANALFMDNNGGNSRFYSSGPNGTTQGSYEFNIMASDANPLQTALVINNSGKVGIGTTSPASPLVVVGTGVGSSGTIGIQGANAHVGFKNSSGTFRSWVGHFNAAGHGSDADLNVKTGYSSVGNIRFTADGDTTAAQMFLQGSTGNVGIGTTSPSYKLEVNGSLRASSNIYAISTYALVLDSNEGSGPQLTFGSTSDTDSFGRIAQHSSKFQFITQSRNFEWLNGSSSLMTLQTGGNVGIGTTSPNHKVDIYSDENVPLRIHRPSNGNLNSAGAWGIGFSTRGDTVTSTTDTRAGIFSYYNGNLFFATNTSSVVADPDASARMTILNTGYVGIGTMSPVQPLSVHGNFLVRTTNADGNKNRMQCIVGGSSDAANLYLYHGNSGDGTVSVRINAQGDSYFNGGDVGIGTTSPDNKLHVEGSVNDGVRIEIDNQNTGNASYAALLLRGQGNNFELRNWGDQVPSRTNTTEFHSSSGGDFVFTPANSEAMRIKSDGKVGIGTTLPSSKLTIVSEANVGSLEFLAVNAATTTNKIIFSEAILGDESFFIEHDGAGAGAANLLKIFGDGAGGTAGGITIQRDGKVGIGTTSPSDLLTVTNSSTGDAALRLQTTTGGDPTIYFNSAAANRSGLIRYQDNGTNVGRIEYVHNGDKLQFQAGSATGQILELTNSAATFAGNIRTTATGGGTGILMHTNSGISINSNLMQFWTGQSSGFKFYANSSGNETNALMSLNSSGALTVTSDVVAFSDIKLKENIKTLDGSKVYDMRGVSFDRIDTGKKSSGVIAQEIQKIAPELVNKTDGTLGVAYGNLTGYLIEAVKELKAEIEELKKQIK